MADVSKLRSKRSGGLGSPPGPDDVATSLNAPEIAPAAQVTDVKPVIVETTGEPYVRRDGRSARKTNRTLAFATRVTPEFDKEIRDIADREDLKLVEVLEKAVEAYKEKMGY
ncbi:hypothetical protein [Erwinia persicina]|uniref:hypothetical protein n=1 Tax=Erwinia persicina TaxID=55211 RepID=UPI00177FDDF6|nr:hypothetical protein [Erwinia persicina]